MLLLRGERQFSAYTRLLPWDHVAGTFLIREAGGESRLLNGTLYDPRQPVGDLLNATSVAIWRKLRSLMAADDAETAGARD